MNNWTANHRGLKLWILDAFSHRVAHNDRNFQKKNHVYKPTEKKNDFDAVMW